MISYDEWKPNDMLWNSKVMIWDFKAYTRDSNVSYGVCYNWYAWITVKKKLRMKQNKYKHT